MAGKRLRYGAWIFVIASVQFILAMLIAQMAFPCHNGVCYNVFTNPISDYGNTAMSPLWPLFNYSLVMFGVLLIVGILYLLDAFPKSWLRTAGAVSLILAALGAIGVGVVPENTILAIHSISALIAFGFAGLAVILLGLALAIVPDSKQHRAYIAYTLLSGIIPLAVLFLELLPAGGIHSALSTSGPGWGFGGVERIIAIPPVLWILVTGLYYLRKRK